MKIRLFASVRFIVVGVVFAALFVCVLSGARSDSAKQSATRSPLDGFAIVDLTHPLKADMPVFPGGETFQLTKLADLKDGYYLNKMCLGEHCGTHVDAPNHFVAGGKSIDEIPLERLTGPLVILDVEKQAAANPDFEVRLADVRQWEQTHGPVPAGAFVAARTGWSKKWGDPAAYINKGPDGQPHFPGFGLEAGRFLVRERKIAGLAIDTLSIDPGISKDFPVHLENLKAGGVNFENVANLERASAQGATIMAAPLRIANGSGSPARIFALVPKPAGPSREP